MKKHTQANMLEEQGLYVEITCTPNNPATPVNPLLINYYGIVTGNGYMFPRHVWDHLPMDKRHTIKSMLLMKSDMIGSTYIYHIRDTKTTSNQNMWVLITDNPLSGILADAPIREYTIKYNHTQPPLNECAHMLPPVPICATISDGGLALGCNMAYPVLPRLNIEQNEWVYAPIQINEITTATTEINVLPFGNSCRTNGTFINADTIERAIHTYLTVTMCGDCQTTGTLYIYRIDGELHYADIPLNTPNKYVYYCTTCKIEDSFVDTPVNTTVQLNFTMLTDDEHLATFVLEDAIDIPLYIKYTKPYGMNTIERPLKTFRELYHRALATVIGDMSYVTAELLSVLEELPMTQHLLVIADDVLSTPSMTHDEIVAKLEGLITDELDKHLIDKKLVKYWLINKFIQ